MRLLPWGLQQKPCQCSLFSVYTPTVAHTYKHLSSIVIFSLFHHRNIRILNRAASTITHMQIFFPLSWNSLAVRTAKSLQLSHVSTRMHTCTGIHLAGNFPATHLNWRIIYWEHSASHFRLLPSTHTKLTHLQFSWHPNLLKLLRQRLQGGCYTGGGGGCRMTERQKNRDAESGREWQREKNARESNRAIKKSQKKDRKKEERSCCLLAAWLVGAHRVCSEFCRASVAPVFPINLSPLWQPPAAAS